MSAGSAGTGEDVVAGTLGGDGPGDVVALSSVSEAGSCRLAFSRLSRINLDTILVSVRAVLPHGNSTGERGGVASLH